MKRYNDKKELWRIRDEAKNIYFLLTVSMLFSSNVYASESSAENKNDSDTNYEQLLIKNGYNLEMVDNMDDNSKK